jgi:hypothetical protein
MITSWPPASICCTCTPSIDRVGVVAAGVLEDLVVGRAHGVGAPDADLTPPASVLCRMSG